MEPQRTLVQRCMAASILANVLTPVQRVEIINASNETEHATFGWLHGALCRQGVPHGVSTAIITDLRSYLTASSSTSNGIAYRTQ